jgi:predicted dehydrogenase
MGQAKKKVRYAVIGAGRITQGAVLPAFQNARENSELVALISGDEAKRASLAERYRIPLTGDYNELEFSLDRGAVDAVYIAAPNSQHREFTERAARMGAHVLCEKPMAVTLADCEAMLEATRDRGVKLMIGYRLHFEEGTLRAIDRVRHGELGRPKIFSSVFTQQVRSGDIRTQAKLGGGALLDMGVYPINMARALFGDEPIEVSAFRPPSIDPRFAEVDETTTVMLRFPAGGVAQLTASIGAAQSESYRIICERGELRSEPCYGVSTFKQTTVVDGESAEQTFPVRDQFAPELIYFSRCILEHREPEPSGEEGWCDVRVVNAAFESIESGRSVLLTPYVRTARPDLSQSIHKPALKSSEPVIEQALPPHLGVPRFRAL